MMPQPGSPLHSRAGSRCFDAALAATQLQNDEGEPRACKAMARSKWAIQGEKKNYNTGKTSPCGRVRCVGRMHRAKPQASGRCAAVSMQMTPGGAGLGVACGPHLVRRTATTSPQLHLSRPTSSATSCDRHDVQSPAHCAIRSEPAYAGAHGTRAPCRTLCGSADAAAVPRPAAHAWTVNSHCRWRLAGPWTQLPQASKRSYCWRAIAPLLTAAVAALSVGPLAHSPHCMQHHTRARRQGSPPPRRVFLPTRGAAAPPRLLLLSHCRAYLWPRNGQKAHVTHTHTRTPHDMLRCTARRIT